MSWAKELKSQLDNHRNNVINIFKTTALLFKNFEVECEIEKPIQFEAGMDDQDESQMPEYVNHDGSIVIYHQGNEVGTFKPEECKTEFLLEVLEEMENQLEKLRTENSN